MAYAKKVQLVVVLVLAGSLFAAAGEKRPVTVEDCVCARRIVRQELALSPTGSYVAYIVKAPDVKTNKNHYRLYVRELKQTSRRENGRLLFQSEDLSGLGWLADGRRIAVLSRERERNSVRIIDINTGSSELAVDRPARIEEYTISANGDVVVFSTKLPGVDASEERARRAHGVPVTLGQPVGRSGIEMFNPQHELYAVEKANNGKRKARHLEFSGLGLQNERALSTLHLVNLNLSPDGSYLLFAYRSAWLPEGWEATPFVKRTRENGLDPFLIVLYHLRSGRLRLAFNAPHSGGGTTWADDSRAFAIQSTSPIGSPEYQKETEAALASGEVLTMGRSETPFFAVDVESGSVTQVLPKLPRVRKRALSWKRSDGQMLVQVDGKTLAWMSPRGSEWKEVSRTTLSLRRHNNRYPALTNGEVVVGVSETPMEPPDLFLNHIKTNLTVLLTNLNPEFRQIALGQVEELQWTNKYGAKTTGYLVKPVGYRAGKRYPLVIMTKGWGNIFLCDTQYQTAFPPQPLANAGFVVLMADDRSWENKAKNYPGDMGEAYSFMAMVESAVELLVEKGMVDKDNVGLMGFSRQSWKTDFMLTHSGFRFAAASSADGGLYNYGSYWHLNSETIRAFSETQLGGSPYGEAFQNWLEYAPAFNAKNVRTPLLMEYTSSGVHSEPTSAYEFFTALKRQGKPVELYFYPQGEHVLDTPWERVASLQRNLDWFRFWMQGYEGTAPDFDPELYLRWRALRKQHQENQQKLAAKQRE